MQSPATFFAHVKQRMGGTLEQSEVTGLNAVLDAMKGAPLAYTAYALATAYHETAGTMLPVREAYWRSESWRSTHLRYYPYYGRGYVQLTWERNYDRAAKELGLGDALDKSPDLAMRPDIAAKIMRRGMDEGWFTGSAFRNFLPARGLATPVQFKMARKIINGTDRDVLVATYATQFQDALVAGVWL